MISPVSPREATIAVRSGCAVAFGSKKSVSKLSRQAPVRLMAAARAGSSRIPQSACRFCMSASPRSMTIVDQNTGCGILPEMKNKEPSK
jgi:hypothetical protein